MCELIISLQYSHHLEITLYNIRIICIIFRIRAVTCAGTISPTRQTSWDTFGCILAEEDQGKGNRKTLRHPNNRSSDIILLHSTNSSSLLLLSSLMYQKRGSRRVSFRRSTTKWPSSPLHLPITIPSSKNNSHNRGGHLPALNSIRSKSPLFLNSSWQGTAPLCLSCSTLSTARRSRPKGPRQQRPRQPLPSRPLGVSPDSQVLFTISPDPPPSASRTLASSTLATPLVCTPCSPLTRSPGSRPRLLVTRQYLSVLPVLQPLKRGRRSSIISNSISKVYV